MIFAHILQKNESLSDSQDKIGKSTNSETQIHPNGDQMAAIVERAEAKTRFHIIMGLKQANVLDMRDIFIEDIK